MTEEEIRWSVDQIILQASVMYGVKPLDSEKIYEYLSDAIKKLLLEFGGSELTLEEFILGLWINITGHKYLSGNDIVLVPIDGQFVSVKFLAGVMHNYISIRYATTRTIENHLDGYQQL